MQLTYLYIKPKPDLDQAIINMAHQACTAVGIDIIDNVQDADAILVLGGDGTVLYAVHETHSLGKPYIAVAAGSLGFLTCISPGNLTATLERFQAGEMQRDKRQLLQIEHYHNDRLVDRHHALNEAVLSQQGAARVSHIHAQAGNHELTTYRSDGVIVATPTGSTAYNLSAGGPIVVPQLPVYMVTPIAPHSFSQKPIVLEGSTKLDLTPCSTGELPLTLTVDGREVINLGVDERIRVSLSTEYIQFMRLPEERFFKTLKSKLSWG